MSATALIKTMVRNLGYDLRDINYVPKSYDRKIYEYYLKNAGEVRTIFDVGANVGQTALPFSASFPDARIYSFEPFLRVFEQLKENTAHLTQVRCVQLALGDAPGVVSVASDPVDSSVSTLLDARQQELRDAGVREVETITVQDGASYCQEHQITGIDILKIDTEGFEIPVLDGFGGMLGPAIRSILCEFCLLENRARQTPLLTLCERLKGHGYALASVYDIRHEANQAS